MGIYWYALDHHEKKMKYLSAILLMISTICCGEEKIDPQIIKWLAFEIDMYENIVRDYQFKYGYRDDPWDSFLPWESYHYALGQLDAYRDCLQFIDD